MFRRTGILIETNLFATENESIALAVKRRNSRHTK